MLKAIFTLDYEIHGNGDGNPYLLMVEPTARMLDQFDQYGAKLTIMADIAEILKFKQYFEESGKDDYNYESVAQQLRDAIKRGHDVQLHIHSSYFNASYSQGKWVQDWNEYDFARLDPNRMDEMVKCGKNYLETLLRPVDPNYQCNVFRAANWSVCPSEQVIKTLSANGIKIETSVFKYGKRAGRVNFDYNFAESALVPWRVDNQDICKKNTEGKLWEFPIYSESRWIGAFLTYQRIYRAIVGRFHKIEQSSEKEPLEQALPKQNKWLTKWEMLTKMHAWKADFNQCTGQQLIAALLRSEKKFVKGDEEYPFVLIGHSKLFTSVNAFSLKFFLEFIAKHPQRFGFGRFSDFNEKLNLKEWDAV